jgi:hypothetical protein
MPTTPRRSAPVKTLVTISKDNEVYLQQTLVDLSIMDAKATKSDLFGIALSLLRKQSSAAIKKLLARAASH